MAENIFNSRTDAQPEPQGNPTLRRNLELPKGVLRKNLKTFVYLGAALLVIVAALFSSSSKKTPAQQAERERSASPTGVTRQHRQQRAGVEKSDPGRTSERAAGNDGRCSNRRPGACVGDARAAGCRRSLRPERRCCSLRSRTALFAITARRHADATNAGRTADAANRRERAGTRGQLTFRIQPCFLPLRRTAATTTAGSGDARPVWGAERQANGGLVAPESEAKREDTPGGYKRPLEANVDSATGQPYLIYEGSVLDTVLMNRLDGDAVGPVKVLVSNPLYSHDHQHVIIPEGTVVLGEAKKIGATGFGQQRRMAVVFHRLIMPDGYSVDLDQFQGLDQIGEQGLKDKVNNHYLQIFGTSIALGVVAGASQITQGGGTITTSGSQAFTNGAAGSVSQSAASILDRFIQIPPTITIREGHRVKVYFTQDLLLPAYSNHTIPQSF